MAVIESLACSEDSHWACYRRDGSLTRGQVMAHWCRCCEEYGSLAWFETLRAYRVYAGFARVLPAADGYGEWHWECEATDEGAFPVWIVRRRDGR